MRFVVVLTLKRAYCHVFSSVYADTCPLCPAEPVFGADDITRAEAKQRIKSRDPLPVHREMQKIHKEFKQKGGAIHVLGDLPEIIWNNAHTIIKTVNYYE